ncbi:MAG TPA: hypothetical protein P5556_03200 [Candidatus Gastranaerophilales bacterium]|nr:hypothetical protein [Candidatus Gastranaerophilales bacterium]
MVNPIASNNWQNIKFAPMTPEVTSSPLNLNSNKNNAPLAAMSVEEALYGKPQEKKHTMRNVILGSLATAAALYTGAKYGAPKITKEGSKIKEYSAKLVSAVDEAFKSAKDKVTGLFKSKPAETPPVPTPTPKPTQAQAPELTLEELYKDVKFI